MTLAVVKRIRHVYEFKHYSSSPIPPVTVVTVATFFSPASALREYLETYHEMLNVGAISLAHEGEGIWSYRLGAQESVWIRRKS